MGGIGGGEEEDGRNRRRREEVRRGRGDGMNQD